MEMQVQGFHSENRSFSSAASNEPDDRLQLSSMSFDSTLSCLSSATLPTSSPPPISASPIIPSSPPPATDPQQPRAESPHCSIPILPSAPVVPLGRRPPSYYPKKEEALKSLRESVPHSMKLSQLLKSERGFQKEASSHKKLMRRHSKDLYMVVSIYAVLQGALFTAVAQSSIFTCVDWWGPAGIVGVVTIGTVFSAVDKLRRMGYQRQEVKKSERRQSAVYDKIEQLYCSGSWCEIESLEPAYEDVFNNEAGSMCIFSVHGLLVLGFLLGFSALMMISCTRMLTCSPCHCHH